MAATSGGPVRNRNGTCFVPVEMELHILFFLSSSFLGMAQVEADPLSPPSLPPPQHRHTPTPPLSLSSCGVGLSQPKLACRDYLTYFPFPSLSGQQLACENEHRGQPATCIGHMTNQGRRPILGSVIVQICGEEFLCSQS